MWSDILTANAGPVADVLDGVVDDLQRTVAALRRLEQQDEAERGAEAVAGVLRTGVAGQSRIPGKHGAAPSAYREISVIVADRPGELARLFVAVGDAGVNLEDIRIEHVFGRPSGWSALFVRPEAGERLIAALGATRLRRPRLASGGVPPNRLGLVDPPSSPSTVPPAPASRASAAGWPNASACVTWTPGPCTGR